MGEARFLQDKARHSGVWQEITPPSSTVAAPTPARRAEEGQHAHHLRTFHHPVVRSRHRCMRDRPGVPGTHCHGSCALQPPQPSGSRSHTLGEELAPLTAREPDRTCAGRSGRASPSATRCVGRCRVVRSPRSGGNTRVRASKLAPRRGILAKIPCVRGPSAQCSRRISPRARGTGVSRFFARLEGCIRRACTGRRCPTGCHRPRSAGGDVAARTAGPADGRWLHEQ